MSEEKPPGGEAPHSSTGQSSVVGEAIDGVPAVPTPLKVQPYLDKHYVCSSLKKAQAQQLGISKPKAGYSVDELMVTCDVHDKDAFNSVHFGFYPNFSLKDVCSRKGDWFQSGYFIPSGNVQGYPMVVGNADDARPDGACRTYVGVTNDVAFTAMYIDDRKNG